MRAVYVEKKVTEYFQDEYLRLEELLKEPPGWLSKGEAIHNCLQRCLGVAQFAQVFNADFEYLEALMTDLREKCYKL
jgi:hypothetical protein